MKTTIIFDNLPEGWMAQHLGESNGQGYIIGKFTVGAITSSSMMLEMESEISAQAEGESVEEGNIKYEENLTAARAAVHTALSELPDWNQLSPFVMVMEEELPKSPGQIEQDKLEEEAEAKRLQEQKEEQERFDPKPIDPPVE